MKNNRDSVLFNRYIVEIGRSGKVVVKSKAQFNKPLKVYGKKKDGLRFVNLKNNNGVTEAYDLEAIKSHMLEGGILVPLTKEQLNNANKYEQLPDIIEDSFMIESLPIITDRFGNAQHYHDTTNYNVYYQRVNYSNLSNGFEKYHYNVVFSNKWNPYTLTKRTKVFINKDKVIITDINKVSDSELDVIFKLVNDERIKRKLDKFKEDFSTIRDRDSVSFEYYQHQTKTLS